MMITTEEGEELGSVPLNTSGKIPSWLSGTLVRNGPVYVSVEGKTIEHWFDGLGMLHAFKIHEGQVVYSNRFLRSSAYKKVFEEGSFNYLSFASDPCRPMYQRYLTLFTPSMGEPIKNANVNVAKMADQYVALTEIPLPVCFDIDSLETLGVLDYKDQLPNERHFQSAHPHHDADKAEMVSYLVEYGWRSAYVAFKLPDGSNCREVIARLPVQSPSYMHSFALTRNYLIFAEFPLIVHPIDFITKDKPFIKQFVWEPDRGTRFTIIKRDTGVVAGRVTVPPFFAFHHANAYEKGEEIIVDLIAYPDASIVGQMAKYGSMESSIADIDALNENIDTSLRRFKIDLSKQTIQSSTIYEGPLEFPRINDFANDGREYKYLYAVDPRLLSPQIDRLNLYKISVEEKLALQWSEIGCQPGEPVFVPAPTRSKEDDGIVLSVVFDSKRGHSFLLVLDAGSFCEIGRAEVPHKVPLGLHGQFFFENV